MSFKDTFASSFTLDYSLKGIGIGKHILNKQITGEVEQMLSNLDMYSPEFILLEMNIIKYQ